MVPPCPYCGHLDDRVPSVDEVRSADQMYAQCVVCRRISQCFVSALDTLILRKIEPATEARLIPEFEAHRKVCPYHTHGSKERAPKQRRR